MSSIKREIRHFHVVVVQKREKKCTKKRDARAKLMFCLLNLLVFFFFTFSLPSASLDLKVPIFVRKLPFYAKILLSLHI